MAYTKYKKLFKDGGQPCCGAINESHTRLCYRQQLSVQGTLETVRCWCCGGIIVAMHSFVWSTKGAQCLACWNDCRHNPACGKFQGQKREWPAGDASALGAMFQMAVIAGLEVGTVIGGTKLPAKNPLTPVQAPTTALSYTVLMAAAKETIHAGDFVKVNPAGQVEKASGKDIAFGFATRVDHWADPAKPDEVTVQVAGQTQTVAPTYEQFKPILMVPPGSMKPVTIAEAIQAPNEHVAKKQWPPRSWTETWTDDDELRGAFFLSGVDHDMPKALASYLKAMRPGSDWDDAHCIRVLLQRSTEHGPGPAFALVGLEDPDDGYRSRLGELFRVPDGGFIGGKVKNTFGPQPVLLEQPEDGNGFTGLDIIDERSGQTIVSIGTNYSDDYYPTFVGTFWPEKMWINGPGKAIDKAVHEVLEERTRKEQGGRNYRPIILED